MFNYVTYDLQHHAHELHGRVDPKKCIATCLVAVAPLSMNTIFLWADMLGVSVLLVNMIAQHEIRWTQSGLCFRHPLPLH